MQKRCYLPENAANWEFTPLIQIFQPLLFLLAKSTHHELAKQVEWLKAENQMLRRRVPKQPIFLSDKEKARLVKIGRELGYAQSGFGNALVPFASIRNTACSC